MTRLILLFFTIAGFGFILFQLAHFLISIGGSRAKMQKDFHQLRSLANEWLDKLTPISAQELKLLSMKVLSQKVGAGIYYTEKGAMYSIYDEPMISYAYKKYFDDKAILVAATKDATFEFTLNNFNTELRINNFNKGIISKDGQLLSADGMQHAMLDLDALDGHHKILLEKKAVATIVNPQNDYSDQTRVFTVLDELQDKDQENVLLALTIYDILLR